MRDFIAALVALLLVFFALGLATTLTTYRRRRQQQYAAERALGRSIVAELPVESDSLLFTEDDAAFHYGDHAIDKTRITGVRVLVNGSPMASYRSTRWPAAARPDSLEDREDRAEGTLQDRWDVAIETTGGVTLVECGAVRERVSQDLARQVYDAVRHDLERRDAAATTTRPQGDRPDG